MLQRYKIPLTYANFLTLIKKKHLAAWDKLLYYNDVNNPSAGGVDRVLNRVPFYTIPTDIKRKGDYSPEQSPSTNKLLT